MTSDVAQMRDAYLRAALFTASGEDGEPLNREFDVTDFDDTSRTEAYAVCASFVEQHAALLEEGESGVDPDQAGHDLWMTRNGHGAGFWEEEWGKAGERLSTAAARLGEAHVFLSENEDGGRYLYIAVA